MCFLATAAIPARSSRFIASYASPPIKLAIYRAWPWISNCGEWDPNPGLPGLESSALTTRPRRPGANLRRDPTSHVLFLNQSVLADFDDRREKKKDSHFKTRSLSGTSNNNYSYVTFYFSRYCDVIIAPSSAATVLIIADYMVKYSKQTKDRQRIISPSPHASKVKATI